MSLLALISSATGTSDDGLKTYPYPEGIPYNVAFPLDIPTPPDGRGQVVHPSVKDMGEAGWNGYRFWMAITPYPFQDVSKENPCIYCSHDGITWVEPSGIVNPIYPWQGGETWNNDPDLEFDPATGRMWCWWRYSQSTMVFTVWAAWSTDGSTWSTPQVAVESTQVEEGDRVVSPAIVRVADDDWRMFTPRSSFYASSPEGPWVYEGGYSVPPATPHGRRDHIDVVHDDGQFRALILLRADPWSLVASSSLDGRVWTPATEPLIVPQPRSKAVFDNNLVYRATLTPHGDDYNVWYGGVSVDNVWKVGHTRIPKSHWPDATETF